MDYSMWSILEAEACSKPHQSIDALKKRLKAWNAIPQEVIDRAVDDFPKRLKKCIEAGDSLLRSHNYGQMDFQDANWDSQSVSHQSKSIVRSAIAVLSNYGHRRK
uniref:Uncharacterized protein n=1 Tax=Acrobeloides nanus TaxID=290746 RepID=A0A914DH75_9BILA